MARLVIGGYAEDFNINLPERTCRAIQNAMLERLDKGHGLFFRFGGEKSDGSPIQTVTWIAPHSSLRFEYDVDLMPDLDEKLAGIYKNQLSEFGGIAFPSKAEMDKWEAEEAATV